MARIRSVHPGLFTDADFAFLSSDAQVLFIGILTECDDYGAFPWNPRDLKLRLRPGKDGPVDPFLEELEAANRVMSYEHAGRKYGLVRNFGKYQRPKKPKSTHFIPPEFRTYASSNSQSSEPEDDDGEPVPQKSEMSSQMEDGGDKMEDGGGVKDIPPNPQVPLAVEAWNETAIACGLPRAQNITDKRRKAIALRLKDVGGFDGWIALLEKIRGSPFLRGNNRDGWRCDLDWVLKPANLTKIMEGNYDDRKSANGIQGAIDDLRRGV